MASERARWIPSDGAFRAIFEHSPDLLLLTDADGVIRYQNAAIPSALGYRQDELVGHSVLDFVHPDDHPSASACLARIISNGPGHVLVTVRFRHASGAWRWFKGQGSNLLAHPALRSVVIKAQDVTDDRETHAVRASTTLLDTVITSAPIAMFVIDRSLTYRTAKGRALERAGLVDVELVGRSLHEVHADAPVLIDTVRRALSGETVAIELPFGSRLLSIWYSPFTDADDSAVSAVIGVAFDVTEQRQLTDHLRQVQKLESIGLLAGGIAHDFNNMLTVIRGHTDLLLEEREADSDRVSSLEQIQQAANKASMLTYQLLAFSRKQVLQPQVLDVNDVIGDTLKLLQRLIGENIVIRTRLEAVEAIEADPGQITQVLMNLAVNARDAMPNGGILSVETSNVELDALYARAHQGVKPGRYVLIAVSDNGVGIEPAVLKRIFEPFFTTKAIGQGTGMGLSTVYGIVKQSGGNVWAYSEPGQGTCVRVYLPRVGLEPTQSAEAPETMTLPRGTETILLVEDEDLVRALSKRVLVGCGYSVLDAASPSEAIRVAKRHPQIDLLLTDMVMPGGSGVGLAEELRGLLPAFKVIYMSGYTFDSITANGVLPSDIEFLQKPFTAQSLTSRVRAVLDR